MRPEGIQNFSDKCVNLGRERLAASPVDPGVAPSIELPQPGGEALKQVLLHGFRQLRFPL